MDDKSAVEHSDRDRYALEALRSIPKLLQLIDRNQFSSTYGCFDRSYWHYRTMDFPSGMYQEFVLPLALVYAHHFVNNPYYQQPRIKQLVEAGIDFARRSAHRDGSCDDYFPHERALGALVFSLYAMTESYLVLQLQQSSFVEFFARRADWLIHHQETGQLANHQALAALALYNVYMITGNGKYRQASEARKQITLSWQHSEGWFQEYEGADPGYHSCTIDFLAKLRQKSGDDALLEPLKKAVRFAWHFAHPDGSYAGEYGSRNTYHFYPHGFELMAPHLEEAGQIADHFLKIGLPRGTRYYNEDDRMCAHYVYNHLQAYLNYHPQRPPDIRQRADFEQWFDEAKLFVKKNRNYYAVAALNKGGVIKAFNEEGCLASDTGIMAKTSEGKVLVANLVDPEHTITIDPRSGRYSVEGHLSLRRSNLPTPFKLIVFRLLLLTIGRFSANLTRALLQKILITGKPRSKVRFRRDLQFADDGISVRDEILAPPGMQFASLACGSDATSIYVANSNVYQRSVLTEWTDLNAHVDELNQNGKVVIERKIV